MVVDDTKGQPQVVKNGTSRPDVHQRCHIKVEWCVVKEFIIQNALDYHDRLQSDFYQNRNKMFDIDFWNTEIHVSQGSCIKKNQRANYRQEGIGHPKKEWKQIVKVGVQHHQIRQVYIDNKDCHG